MIIEINGEIIPNDYEWIYDWFKMDNTTPNKIKAAIAALEPDEELEVRINSPGGDVASGQEIYSLLQTVNSRAEIMGMAASAAGFAAMGCKRVEMSPVGTIMVHNVWMSGVEGDYHEMDKASEMLKSLNKSIANAFVVKSGMPEEKVLKMMDKETWLTANQAVEYGIADAIIGNPEGEPGRYRNSLCGMSITPDMVARAIAERDAQDKQVQDRTRELIDDLDSFGY